MPKGPQGQKRPADAIGLAVMVGAVFERSHVGLAKWMLAFRLMASAKKGVPAHLLHRTLGVGVPRDISQRLGKLRALAGDNLGGDQRRIVVALCDRGTVAAPKRNLALHGNWMLHHGLGVVAAVSWFKVTLDEPLQALPIDDLPPLVLEVGQVGRIMLDLLVKRGAELPGPGTQLGA